MHCSSEVLLIWAVKKKRDGSQIVPISEVKVWDKNPRGCKKDDFARLKKQIQKFGVYKPLIACDEYMANKLRSFFFCEKRRRANA